MCPEKYKQGSCYQKWQHRGTGQRQIAKVMSVVIEDAVPDHAIGLRGILGTEARVTLSGEIKRDSDRQSGQRRVHRIKGVGMAIEQLHGCCNMNGLIESLGSPSIGANYADHCNDNQDRCEKKVVAAFHLICARGSVPRGEYNQGQGIVGYRSLFHASRCASLFPAKSNVAISTSVLRGSNATKKTRNGPLLT